MSNRPPQRPPPPPPGWAGPARVTRWWKSPWLVWNAVGLLVVAAVLLHVAIGKHSDVGFVKNTRLDGYGDSPLGEVLDQFMNEPQWEEVVGEDGQRYVVARGRVDYMSRSSIAAIRFRVGLHHESIGLEGLEIDGQPKTILVASDFLRKAYGGYQQVLLKR